MRYLAFLIACALLQSTVALADTCFTSTGCTVTLYHGTISGGAAVTAPHGIYTLADTNLVEVVDPRNQWTTSGDQTCYIGPRLENVTIRWSGQPPDRWSTSEPCAAASAWGSCLTTTTGQTCHS